MFQQILGVKKFEHQLLYNVLQVRGKLRWRDGVHRWDWFLLVNIFMKFKQ